MKIYLIITLILSALFATSCGSGQKTQSELKQNKETSEKKEMKETSSKRHVKVKSENSFDDTYTNLKKAIESKEPLKIIAELNHSDNAKKADLELRPTKIIMFGNPKLGTPLMLANQEIGIDLPQKMLVYEDEKGDVYVVYNDPNHLTKKHNINGKDEVLGKISGALKGLADAAAKLRVR